MRSAATTFSAITVPASLPRSKSAVVTSAAICSLRRGSRPGPATSRCPVNCRLSGALNQGRTSARICGMSSVSAWPATDQPFESTWPENWSWPPAERQLGSLDRGRPACGVVFRRDFQRYGLCRTAVGGQLPLATCDLRLAHIQAGAIELHIAQAGRSAEALRYEPPSRAQPGCRAKRSRVTDAPPACVAPGTEISSTSSTMRSTAKLAGLARISNAAATQERRHPAPAEVSAMEPVPHSTDDVIDPV